MTGHDELSVHPITTRDPLDGGFHANYVYYIARKFGLVRIHHSFVFCFNFKDALLLVPHGRV